MTPECCFSSESTLFSMKKKNFRERNMFLFRIYNLSILHTFQNAYLSELPLTLLGSISIISLVEDSFQHYLHLWTLLFVTGFLTNFKYAFLLSNSCRSFKMGFLLATVTIKHGQDVQSLTGQYLHSCTIELNKNGIIRGKHF